MYITAGTHAEVAHRLGVSVHTVHAHLAALRSRLGVHNEAQAVYVLWLGYRDHIDTCSERHHERCLPDLEQLLVRQATSDEESMGD